MEYKSKPYFVDAIQVKNSPDRIDKLMMFLEEDTQLIFTHYSGKDYHLELPSGCEQDYADKGEWLVKLDTGAIKVFCNLKFKEKFTKAKNG